MNFKDRVAQGLPGELKGALEKLLEEENGTDREGEATTSKYRKASDRINDERDFLTRLGTG